MFGLDARLLIAGDDLFAFAFWRLGQTNFNVVSTYRDLALEPAQVAVAT
jgi:hypothetical protein